MTPFRTLLGVLAATLLLALTACGSASQGDPAPPAAPDQPSVAEALVGAWLPQDIAGYDFPTPGDRAAAPVEFAADGTWTGSDGCNGLSGTYEVAADGSFSATAGPQTLIGCANVPNTTVLSDAVRVEIATDRLEFVGSDDAVLGTYTPRP